jgi:hypothetical protein
MNPSNRTTRPSARRPRRGLALALALFGIVVVGAIVSGVVVAGTQEYRVARNQLLQERALAAAEYGLNMTVARWNRSDAGRLKSGDTLQKVYAIPGAIDSVWVTKLNDLTFWVVSVGRAGTGADTESRRRLSQILRLDLPVLPSYGPFVAHGSTNLGGNISVSGADVPPPGWDCPPPGAVAVGIAEPPGVTVTTSGNSCPNLVCVVGSPKVLNEPTLTDTASFSQWASVNWTELRATADLSIAAGTNLSSGGSSQIGPRYAGAGVCDRSAILNWGDPNRAVSPRACEKYFPVVYAAGDLQVSGGTGQGILLVEGDLRVTGDLVFDGIVIVRGSLSTQGTGAHFNGQVIVGNFNNSTNSLTGTPTFQYSRCAAQMATERSVFPDVARDHGWADMY